MTNSIKEFQGENRFLSNFWLEDDGTTNEHRFQAAKTLNPAEQQLVLNAADAKEAKTLGHTITMRPDWDEIKLETMLQLLRTKFSNPTLAKKLDDTGDAELIEGNRWNDTYWGVNIETGEGQNNLGKLLMKVRAENRKHQ